MKLNLMAAVTLGLVAGQAMATTVLKTDSDKLSYTIGADLGKNFKAQGITIDPKLVFQGLEDSAKGSGLLLTPEQMKQTLQSFQRELIKKKMAAMKKAAEVNKAKGEAFLAKNKAAPGVKTLASGLQYKVLSAGKGPTPAKTDSVTVDYTGKLINGTVFDSSEKTGKPATFKVTQVIPGWTEALQLMKQGATWEIYVPSALAYGPRGIGGPIGPNETLIFNIHLREINKVKTANAAKAKDA